MILRRITEHVKAQNWFAVGIDVLIVVVGVRRVWLSTRWPAMRYHHPATSRQRSDQGTLR